ncbi:hypothetical protein AHP1_2471 [Aeromonas phage Ahp1_CNU-2021]|nr:hypothetical protein AHP1_2471 [Aeromonas phage Ahp1_CNU-2021]
MDLRTVCLIVAIIVLLVYLIVDREKEDPDDNEALVQAARLKHKYREAISPLILNGMRRDKKIKGRSMMRTEVCPIYAAPCTNHTTKSRKKKRK